MPEWTRAPATIFHLFLWTTYLLRRPAFKFAGYIAAQAVTTALTISSIAKVGENLAQDLRTELFARMLAQDLTFFETHKSGDLIKRINDDVQTFKSDFKKLVGQGVKQGRVSAQKEFF